MVLSPVTRLVPLLVAMLLAVIPAGPAVADQPFQPSFEPKACSFTLPAGFTDGQNVNCGFVVVETRHRVPASGTIKVAVAVFSGAAEHPAKEPPILYLGGGPSTTVDRLLPPQVRAFTASRDVIIMDQRGVEFSDPGLNCPDVVAATVRDLETLVSRPAMAEDQAAAILACRDRWVAEGIDLAAFNPVETAADVGDVIDALGYHKVDLYGVSFGTQLAIQAMRESRHQIRAVILNSGSAPDMPPTGGGLAVRMRARILQDCAADDACASAFPDIENVFLQAQQALDANPVEVTYTLEGATHTALIDGARFASMVGATASTPSLIWRVAHGDSGVFARSIRGFMGRGGPNYSVGAYLSMTCPRVMSGPRPLTTLSGLVCPDWPIVPPDPEFTSAISSQIPALVLEGTFDSLFLVDASRQLADELGHSTYIVLPGQRHAFPADTNQCVVGVQNAFLEHPSHPLDVSCVAGLEPVFSGT